MCPFIVAPASFSGVAAGNKGGTWWPGEDFPVEGFQEFSWVMSMFQGRECSRLAGDIGRDISPRNLVVVSSCSKGRRGKSKLTSKINGEGRNPSKCLVLKPYGAHMHGSH